MKATRIRVSAANGTYEVVVGSGLLDSLGMLIAPLLAGRHVGLVSDDNVADLYAARAESALQVSGFRVGRFVVPAGEPSKSWRQAGMLLEAMSEHGLERGDAVVALGGGVVGDLAGFCAASYMRGIAVIQVPTTLLAQVDSAIGGKTGVDLPMGKNLAGAFWPPSAVVSDTSVLATLPEAEWRVGMAEVAKSSILDGEASVSGLERDAEALAHRLPEAAERAVLMSARLKARVVSEDEHEAGLRESLNYGHTLGHAIERVAGYGAVAHGVAVAEGMRFAAALGERLAVSEPEWGPRQDRLLTALGLPPMGCAWEPTRLLEAMRADKKVRGEAIRFILTSGPGSWESRVVPEEVISSALEEWCGR